MGQGSSQPQRREEHAPGRALSVRRAFTSRRHHTRSDGLRDELLEGRSSPSRLSSTNHRLSQLFRAGDDYVDVASRDPERHEEPPRNAQLLNRTRSRFHELLRRDSLRPSRSRPSLLHQRASYVRSGQSSNDGEAVPTPPRLPSFDLSTSFDHDTFDGSSADPEAAVPRAESSHRRSNMRLNALRPDRPFRHFTSSLRRRRSPAPPAVSSIRPRGNEDQAAMLSRLLSVAAAATAATLMGDDQNALNEARSLTGSTGIGDFGGNDEDGSFVGFLNALQNGRIASALRQGNNENEGEGFTGHGAPLNFFRMFRFGTSEGNNNQDVAVEAVPDIPGELAGQEGRMVPIIIVGIRSINPNSNAASSSTEDLPPFIDALGNFPAPLPAHALGTHGHDSIDSILRPPQNGTSFRHRRRASMGGLGMGRSRLSDRMDDQRDHRSPDRRRDRPWSVASSSSNHYEPRPPPATPASPSPELSRISSRNSTPNHSRPASFVANSVREQSNDSRRNSILPRASATSPLSSHTEETGSIRSTHSGTGLLGRGPEPYRVHRRSDTAPNIHYPRFASGHPRRNGVVEPDNLPSLSRESTSNDTDSTSELRNGSNDSRSWIIYVLGGSYPENHPILTTPSLFTENPTYEDMMLLSALLGPAKAPVASEEDVQSAGGVYEIDTIELPVDAHRTATLVAIELQGTDQVFLEAGQRCLVCLCDFEAKEIARKLVKCNHLFHRECIDQWLTTGRNSCPLCREQGVDEKKSTSEAEDGPASGLEDAAAGAVVEGLQPVAPTAS